MTTQPPLKAEELKPWNLMLCNLVEFEGNPMYVLQIQMDRIELGFNSIEAVYTIDMDDEDLKPIKLTPEILEKCGFEKIVSPPVAPIWDEDVCYCFNGYRFAEDVYGKWFLLGYNWNTEHFKFVHQLQNLYWSLTGKALNITLTSSSLNP